MTNINTNIYLYFTRQRTQCSENVDRSWRLTLSAQMPGSRRTVYGGRPVSWYQLMTPGFTRLAPPHDRRPNDHKLLAG